MIEIIAMFSMLIDHIGYIKGDSGIYRIIGRLALPLYVYLLVRGYSYTRSVKTYSKRLLFLALISQVPYSIVFNNDKLNVIFTLLLTVLFIYNLERKSIWKLPILCSILLFSYLFASYNVYPIVLAIAFRNLKGTLLLLLVFATATVVQTYMVNNYIQLFALFLLVFVIMEARLPAIQINRWIYRFFYPLHLTIIAIYIILVK